jgi:iron(III) transport system substrate-binding protein
MKIIRTLAALTLALLAASCGDGRLPLTVYSPHGSDLLSLMEKAYEAKHPEIDVRWLDMGSQEVYDRIRSEAANPQADVWYGGPQTIFIRGAEDGLLAPYRPTWADAIPPGSRNSQNLFFGSYRTAPVLVYNTQAVKPEEAPKDWDDLLDPRWKGKILLRDPLASGTMRTLFGMVLSHSVKETGNLDRGWNWLRRFDGQTKEYVQNPALLLEKLNRREGLVTVWELTDMLWQAKRGAPLGYRFAKSGTPVIDDSIGMVKNAPHAAQAKAFIEFVGSVEGQELAAREAFRLPARTDLPPARLPQWAQEVLKEMVPADVDWPLIAKNGQQWMATWDRTVRGHGAAAPKP